MARLVKHDAKGPTKVEIAGEAKWVCMCGLSKKSPFCDGTHKITLDEPDGKLFCYDGTNRKEVEAS